MKKITLLALLLCAGSLAAQTTFSQLTPGQHCDLGTIQLGGASAPWNNSVMAKGVDSNSAAWNASYNNYHLHIDFGTEYAPYGFSYHCVDTSANPGLPVVFVPADGVGLVDSDTAAYPLTLATPPEGGFPTCPYTPISGSGLTDGGDHHSLLISLSGWEYDLWRTGLCGFPTAVNGAVWDMTKFEQRVYGQTSADASGLPILPFVFKYDECVTHPTYVTINGVSSPTCGHGGRFTLMGARGVGINNGSVIPGWVSPATHAAFQCCGASPKNVEGMVIRLKANFDVSALTGAALSIANTMKYYGLYFNDTGSNFYVSGSYDTRWDTENLLTLQNITANSFDMTTLGTVYYNDGRSFTPPTDITVAPVPTGAAPTNTAPTVSATTIIQGQSVTLTRTLGTGASYEYFTGGPPIRSTDTGGIATPNGSTCYAVVSANNFGDTTSPATCVTVLPIPFKGASLKGKR